MKTKIISTICQWAPEAANLIPDVACEENTLADYQLLQKLAELCIEKNSSESEDGLAYVQEIINVVNLLYQEGNQYTRNAIENEFLTIFSCQESPGSLKNHLDLFPNELKKGYIKTILKN
ncbi:hypothetical protein DRF60_05585 [Chryseobacterium elymi]|uniref:DUF7674 domain-containing protein n=1 Tax=Chryseobacterium elymi TaxID=395936 RepID=A0A3D9DMR1_9FLAO|nr:hypothetical protein [Chryseobacterium elymi]REC79304.1 hypothetical protein DRF60_05585 [Chryseobacterium elymi]